MKIRSNTDNSVTLEVSKAEFEVIQSVIRVAHARAQLAIVTLEANPNKMTEILTSLVCDLAEPPW